MKIAEYLNTIAEYYKLKQVTLTITTDDGILSSELVNSFIQDLSPAPVIIANQKTALKGLQKPRYLFVFIEEPEELLLGLRDAEENMFLWQLRGYLHVVICKPVNDTIWVQPAAEELWQSSILDFVIIYYHENVTIVEYNPFLKTLIEIAPSRRSKLFSNKLQNIHGHVLKVSMFPDPPRVIEKEGILEGTDPTILRDFMQKINATLEILIARGNNTETYFDEYYLDVTYKFVDFGFMSSFSFDEQNDDIKLKFTYPERMDNVVVVVPRSERIPQYKYIFLVFGAKLWITIVGTAGTISLLKYIFSKILDVQSLVSFLDAYAILLSQSVGSLVGGNTSIKFLLMVWLYGSMILNVAFQCSLTSIMITPKYQKNIDTLEELHESNLKILINPYHIKNVPKHSNLRKQMIVEYESTILNKMMKGDTDKAYAVQLSIAEAIVSQKYVGNLPIYHIVDEYLVPGLSIYVFPAKSPYLEAADKYLLLDQQFGISKYKKKAISLVKIPESDDEDVPLRLDHLQTVFYILFIGYILGIATFAIELFVKKYTR